MADPGAGAIVLQPSKDHVFLNRVLNHPEVSKWMLGLKPPFDCSKILQDPDTIFLANEHGGFLFLKEENQNYDVHTQFLPEGRGDSLRLARDAAFWMFTRSDAMSISTYVPYDNPAALRLTQAVGFERLPDIEVLGALCSYHKLSIKTWARSLCQQLSH